MMKERKNAYQILFIKNWIKHIVLVLVDQYTREADDLHQ
jgi:hypothetical protein